MMTIPEKKHQKRFNWVRKLATSKTMDQQSVKDTPLYLHGGGMSSSRQSLQGTKRDMCQTHDLLTFGVKPMVEGDKTSRREDARVATTRTQLSQYAPVLLKRKTNLFITGNLSEERRTEFGIEQHYNYTTVDDSNRLSGARDDPLQWSVRVVCCGGWVDRRRTRRILLESWWAHTSDVCRRVNWRAIDQRTTSPPPPPASSLDSTLPVLGIISHNGIVVFGNNNLWNNSPEQVKGRPGMC